MGFLDKIARQASDQKAPRTPAYTPRSASTGLRRMRRLLWHGRFALAASLLGIATALIIHILRPPPLPTIDVVVTAHNIAVGTELTREDIALRAIATDAAPPGAMHTVRGLLGRTAVVALPAGAPLHATLVSNNGISAIAPHGTVVVPVRLADEAVASLLRPGDRVDLLAGTMSSSTPATTPQHLARNALVLPVPTERKPVESSGLLGPSPTNQHPITLVAVSRQDAPRLSAVSGWGAVSAVLVP